MLLLVAGVVLLIVATLAVALQWTARPRAADIEWDLVLVGRQGQQVTLSFDEFLDLPSVETRGGYFSSVGTVFGPYTVRGVPVDALCDMVGGLTPADILFVAAQDGYSAVYSYEQLSGEIETFEADPIRLVPDGSAQFLLIYEQDGQPLSHADGAPMRLAIANPDDLITEGHWWVKWVQRIEIRKLPPVQEIETRS